MDKNNLFYLWMAAHVAAFIFISAILLRQQKSNEFIAEKYQEWMCELNEHDSLFILNDSLARVVYYQNQFFDKFVKGHFSYVPCIHSAQQAFRAYMRFNVYHVDTSYKHYYYKGKPIK